MVQPQASPWLGCQPSLVLTHVLGPFLGQLAHILILVGSMSLQIDFYPWFLPKISFQQNFEFSKSVERFKSCNFFPSMYKKKVQEWSGCMLARTWLHGDEDMIVRDQSNNYFHLTPKIGPLCPAPSKWTDETLFPPRKPLALRRCQNLSPRWICGYGPLGRTLCNFCVL